MKIQFNTFANQNVSFQQTYYTKHSPRAYLTSHAKNNYTPEALNWTIENLYIDRNPNPKLTKIVENSNFFQDLNSQGDLYIHNQSNVCKKGFFQDTEEGRLFSALFHDPYDKTLKEPVEIQFSLAKCDNDEIWFDSLSKAVETLPKDYKTFKENCLGEADMYDISSPSENELTGLFIIKEY